jgi:hypothetical protein
MNKEQYIRSRFKDLLKETLEERANDIKKNFSKEVRLNPKNKFDYIEEGEGMCESCGGMMSEGKCNEGCNLEENKSMCESCGGMVNEGEACEECGGEMREGKSMCESCGGMVNEGETCEECGSMYKGDIRELGGMDDGHPRFGKENFNQMTKAQVERLLRGDDDEDEDDYRDLSMYNPYYGDDENMDDSYTDKKSIRTSRRDHKSDMGEGVNLKIDEDDDEYDDFEFKTPVRDAIRSHKGRFKTPVRDAIRSHKGKFETPMRDAIRSRGNRLRDIEDDMSEGVNLEIAEKLYGNQSRIDKNKNNRIDSEDFKMLRKQQDEEQQQQQSISFPRNPKFLHPVFLLS